MLVGVSVGQSSPPSTGIPQTAALVVGEADAVGVSVGVAVDVSVGVAVDVPVAVAVSVGVPVDVVVGVGVGVGVGVVTGPSETCRSRAGADVLPPGRSGRR